MYEAHYYPKKEIIIGQFDDSLFTATYYYFRLGGVVDEGNVVPIKQALNLRKRELKRVFSLETFALSERTFAILGPCTELLFRGLKLHNSPTIDPGFSGSLEMLIENYTDEIVVLEPAMKVGKVVFFDISDSLLDLHQYMQLEKIKATWKTRHEAGQIIHDWIEKNIDTESPKNFRS
jgi:hypothetical protein